LFYLVFWLVVVCLSFVLFVCSFCCRCCLA
jgi:hypothetical protein